MLTSEKESRELIEKFDELMNACEFDALMDLHSVEYRIVVKGDTITGRDLVLKFYKKFYGTGLKSKLLEVMPVAADVKILRVSWKKSTGSGATTCIIRKEAGRWKFLHDTTD
jgi:ketosteroid isomerase-like protein